MALLSSAIPYTLEMIALKAIPARTFGILMSVEPALAAFAGLIFLHEMLTTQQWLAVVLVIAASTGSTLTARRARRKDGRARDSVGARSLATLRFGTAPVKLHLSAREGLIDQSHVR